jgi:hypothetical protein
MSKDGVGSPAGSRWAKRIWQTTVAVLAVAALATAAGFALTGAWSSEPHQKMAIRRSVQPTASAHSGRPTPSPSPTPEGTPEPSPTPAARSSTPTSTQAAPPPASQPVVATKPKISNLSATTNGLLATLSFTVVAPPDRGPFTCTVEVGVLAGPQDFPCAAGPVTRTVNLDYCCSVPVTVTATDGHGVRSDPWKDRINFPKPAQPTHQNVQGWYEDGVVHIAFDVVAAPGDDPVCDMIIDQPATGYHFVQYGHPCEGRTIVSFEGTTDPCSLHLAVKSDSYRLGVEGTTHIIRFE